MTRRIKAGLIIGALAALTLSCGTGVYGDEGTEAVGAPSTLQEFLLYALTHGDKTEARDGSWVKGFNAVWKYRGEFHTDFTTDYKPGKKLEAPKQNFIRYTLVDSKPEMNSPDDFGKDGGKDLIFIQLYNPEAREYIAKRPKSVSIDLVKLTAWGYKERVYSHCYDVGGDGFNDLYDSIVDEHNILELERHIAWAQAGNMKFVGKEKKVTFQTVCDVLTDELYKAIGEGRVVQ